MPLLDVDAPCIGHCSTIFGDAVCRGCGRFEHEVRDWHQWPWALRQSCLQRITQDLEQAVQALLSLHDAQQLEQQLQRHRIQAPALGGWPIQVYALLLAGAEHMQRWEAYGLRLRTSANLTPLQALRHIEQLRLEAGQQQFERWQQNI